MIEECGFGRITIDGKTYTSDVIIYSGGPGGSDRVNASWWRREGHKLQPEDLTEVFAAEPEVLVVGQGNPGLMRVTQAAREAAARRGIELVVCKTKEACRRYNDLAAEGRKVVAALHLTC